MPQFHLFLFPLSFRLPHALALALLILLLLLLLPPFRIRHRLVRRRVLLVDAPPSPSIFLDSLPTFNSCLPPVPVP